MRGSLPVSSNEVKADQEIVIVFANTEVAVGRGTYKGVLSEMIESS